MRLMTNELDGTVLNIVIILTISNILLIFSCMYSCMFLCKNKLTRNAFIVMSNIFMNLFTKYDS